MLAFTQIFTSDDMLIKLWDWDKKWACSQVFEGHTHYVMQIVINPKDNNQFASASLDHTVKVWQLGSPTPNFTLEGHEKGKLFLFSCELCNLCVLLLTCPLQTRCNLFQLLAGRIIPASSSVSSNLPVMNVIQLVNFLYLNCDKSSSCF